MTKHDLTLLKTQKKQTCIIGLNKCDLIKKNLLIETEKLIKNKLKFNKKISYHFLSSKYNFGINNIFKKINEIKKIKEQTISNKDIKKIKDTLNKTITILLKKIYKIKIKKYLPLIIEIYIKNKNVLSKNYKKYISSLIITKLKLKNITIEIQFK